MAEQDRYEPKERLATGLGGERWRALDTRTGADVVMAVLDARTATPAERTRFAAVAEAGATLNHPGLEKVTDRGTTSLGNPFLVHEIIEAPTFAKRLESLPPWSIHEVVRVGTSMLDALAVAHAAGLVHGDLEPERVQVLPAGRARLTCFDLSRASQRIADESWHSSFAYMSPEQANGEPPTAASDVYGVGALIYRAITGVSPRAGSDGSSSRERIIEARLAEVRSVRGEIPQALAAAVERALASEPKVRFTSAAELRKALTSALILSPTVARMHVRSGVTAPTPAESEQSGRTPSPARGTPRVAASDVRKPAPAPQPASASPVSASPSAPVAKSVPVAKSAPVGKSPPASVKPKLVPTQASDSASDSDDGEFLDDLELIPYDEDEDENTKIRQRSEPPPQMTETPEPSARPEAGLIETIPRSAKTDSTTLARVHVKQVAQQRGTGPITREDVPVVVRRRDPRAEASVRPPAPEPEQPAAQLEQPAALGQLAAPDETTEPERPAAKLVEAAPEPAPTPEPKPAPKSERPPLPKSDRPPLPKSDRPPLPPKSGRPAPRSEFPMAPSPFASDRPPAPPAPGLSQRTLLTIGAVSLGTIIAVVIALRTWSAAHVAPLPPHEIPEPEPQIAALPTTIEDAAVTVAPVDASVAIDAAEASAQVPSLPPVIIEPPVTPPSVTAMATTMATSPMTTMTVASVTSTMVTAPVMTEPTMTTTTVMTEPTMTTTMVDTTMRHIETDPGF